MSNFLTACRRFRARVGSVARQVLGAPDYDRYVRHMTACHPGEEPAGLNEFYRTRLEERYNRPGAKCC
jgi:uncharacterized short protein YbdD (DUF466 family)